MTPLLIYGTILEYLALVGDVAERLKAALLKSVRGESSSWVRILPSPRRQSHICARSSADTASIRSAQTTNAFVHYFTHALVAQRIERPVAVREATGSIPVERAIKYPH